MKTRINDVAKFIAQKVIERFGLKPGFDINELVKALNGKIVIDDNLQKCSNDGGSLEFDNDNEKDNAFTIYIPPFTSPLRDRFTIAHELGHFFFDTTMGENKSTYYRNGLNNNSEVLANKFAAELLMPEDDFKNAINHNNDNSYLSFKFKVSKNAVEIRRKSLSI